jgi:transposase
LILYKASGMTYDEISKAVEIGQTRIKAWRNRWLYLSVALNKAESEGISDEELTKKIIWSLYPLNK